MATKFYYVPPENPAAGTHFVGIPMRDLSDEDYDALTEAQKADVDASELYQATKPRGAKAERREEVKANG